MRDIDDDYPSLDVFDAIHRELVTIIGHCALHRSLLQDLILRRVGDTDSPEHTLNDWREESLEHLQQMRFGDLNKQDKVLANSVYEEATRIAESFWNVLLSRVHERERVAPEGASVSAAQDLPPPAHATIRS